MGMSGYILENEENFWDGVSDIIKESEHISDATSAAEVLRAKECGHLDSKDVEEQVEEYWNEIWSKYIW
jgi:hypothetical protein